MKALQKTNRIGVKDDDNKPMLGIVFKDFAHALEDVGRVGTFGAMKYSPHGWERVADADRRYMDAMLRHLLKHLQGEERDPESNLDHLAHMAWNALLVLELAKRAEQELE